MNEEEKRQWWETFDGILDRMRELKEENEALKKENEKLKRETEDGKG